VTPLLQRMREELVRRNYAESTVYTYLQAVDAFRHHIGKRLDHVGPDDLRRYHTFLIEDQKLAVGTVVMRISALRFLYVRVLKRRDMKEDLPYPKRPKRRARRAGERKIRHGSKRNRASRNPQPSAKMCSIAPAALNHYSGGLQRAFR
jgi:site-specific recombinase XerD